MYRTIIELKKRKIAPKNEDVAKIKNSALKSRQLFSFEILLNGGYFYLLYKNIHTHSPWYLDASKEIINIKLFSSEKIESKFTTPSTFTSIFLVPTASSKHYHHSSPSKTKIQRCVNTVLFITKRTQVRATYDCSGFCARCQQSSQTQLGTFRKYNIFCWTRLFSFARNFRCERFCCCCFCCRTSEHNPLTKKKWFG